MEISAAEFEHDLISIKDSSDPINTVWSRPIKSIAIITDNSGIHVKARQSGASFEVQFGHLQQPIAQIGCEEAMRELAEFFTKLADNLERFKDTD